MILAELKKVWKKTFFIKLLVVMLMAMIGLKYYEMNNLELYSSNAYQQLKEDIQGLNEKEIDVYLKKSIARMDALKIIDSLDVNEQMSEEAVQLFQQYQKDYESKKYPRYEKSYDKESAFLEQIYEEFKVIKNYPKMRKEINEQAKQLQNVSLFQKNQTSMTSIMKTVADYNKLELKQIDFHITKGFEVAFMDYIPFIMILLMMFPLVYLLFFEECETGFLYLMKSTARGRRHTIMAKLFALMISILILLLLFYGESLLFSMYFYPAVIYDDPIQSIIGFSNSVLPISVKEYLLLFLLVKWFMCFLIGILFAYLLQKTQNYVVSIFIALVVLLVEYMAYTFLLPTGSFALLKYVNLFAWLDVHTLFAPYYNFVLFHHVFTLYEINVLIALFFFIVFFMLNVYHFITHKEIYHKRGIRRKVKKMRSHSFQYYGLYKVLWSQKVVVVIVCFLLIGIQRVQIDTLNSTQLYEKSFIQDMETLSIKEKANYMKDKDQYFKGLQEKETLIWKQKEQGLITNAQADTMLNTIALQRKPYSAFLKVQTQYQKTVENTSRTLLYEEGYLKLFQSVDEGLLLLLLCVLIMFIPATIFMDKRKSIQLVLNSTPLGKKKRLKQQWRICYVASILLVSFFCVKAVGETFSTYGLTHGLALLNSLSIYEGVTFPISILSFYLIGFLLRIYIILSLSYTIYTLSYYLKKQTQVYIGSAILLFGGWCLHLLGFSVGGFNVVALFYMPYENLFSVWLLYPAILVLLCKCFKEKEVLQRLKRKKLH